MTFTLRPISREAVDATLARFRKHREPAAIVLPTGAGKSLVIAELARPPADACWCWRTSKSWWRKTTPNIARSARRPTFCRRTEAQREPRKSGVWQRTVRRAQPELFRSEFSLLIVDECHRISDDDDSQYQQILTHLKR